mmetsp:Transcript_36762/g.118249  ORF Transcript_36762/g.118249 Transcript_36762/m.118249 type:complete len:293 (+) Transcript_36762:983-1861(+)
MRHAPLRPGGGDAGPDPLVPSERASLRRLGFGRFACVHVLFRRLHPLLSPYRLDGRPGAALVPSVQGNHRRRLRGAGGVLRAAGAPGRPDGPGRACRPGLAAPSPTQQHGRRSARNGTQGCRLGPVQQRRLRGHCAAAANLRQDAAGHRLGPVERGLLARLGARAPCRRRAVRLDAHSRAVPRGGPAFGAVHAGGAPRRRRDAPAQREPGEPGEPGGGRRRGGGRTDLWAGAGPARAGACTACRRARARLRPGPAALSVQPDVGLAAAACAQRPHGGALDPARGVLLFLGGR